MTIDEAVALLSASDYSSSPAQYQAALILLHDNAPELAVGFPDVQTYAAGYAAAHPAAPAGASNTWLWIGAAIGVWWFFFRRR